MPGNPQDRIEAFKKKGNSQCAICEGMANTVLMQHKSFVCQRCSGILREFGLTVKGITMTSWKDSDADEICAGGNKKEMKELMGGWDGSELKVNRDSDDKSVKKFIEAKYVEKRWATGSGGGGGKKDKKRSKSREPEPPPPPVEEKKKKKDKSKKDDQWEADGGDYYGNDAGGQDWSYNADPYYGESFGASPGGAEKKKKKDKKGAAGQWGEADAGDYYGSNAAGQDWSYAAGQNDACYGGGALGGFGAQDQWGQQTSACGSWQQEPQALALPGSGLGAQHNSWQPPGSTFSSLSGTSMLGSNLPTSFHGPPGESPQQKLQRLQQMQQQLRQKLQELKELKARQGMNSYSLGGGGGGMPYGASYDTYGSGYDAGSYGAAGW